jgi:hypothetical protein
VCVCVRERDREIEREREIETERNIEKQREKERESWTIRHLLTKKNEKIFHTSCVS